MNIGKNVDILRAKCELLAHEIPPATAVVSNSAVLSVTTNPGNINKCVLVLCNRSLSSVTVIPRIVVYKQWKQYNLPPDDSLLTTLNKATRVQQFFKFTIVKHIPTYQTINIIKFAINNTSHQL